MGLYGSPDTGNLYSGNDDAIIKKKKRWPWIALAVLFFLVILISDGELGIIVAFLGLFSVGSFLINLIKLFINLIRKKDLRNDVIYILISIVVFAICLALTPSNVENTILGEPKNVNSFIEEPKEIVKKSDLDVLDAEFRDEQYLRYVVGTIINNTDKNYSYVQVEINLYKGEIVVGSTLANVNNLGPGEMWEFKAIVLEEAESFKIKNITGF